MSSYVSNQIFQSIFPTKRIVSPDYQWLPVTLAIGWQTDEYFITFSTAQFYVRVKQREIPNWQYIYI